MSRLAHLVLGLCVTAALVTVAPSPVAATHVCDGNPGYDVWQNINRGGSSARTCWNVARINYGSWTDNIWPFNWNDQVSSVEAYHNTGHQIRFYRDTGAYNPPNYNPLLLSITNNGYASDLRNYWCNDIISSSQWWY